MKRPKVLGICEYLQVQFFGSWNYQTGLTRINRELYDGSSVALPGLYKYSNECSMKSFPQLNSGQRIRHMS
jgi:hypothetical protein